MKTINFRSLGVIVLAISMAGILGGCNSDGPTTFDPGPSARDDSDNRGPEITTGDGLPEFDSDWLFSEATGLKRIFFDYNSFTLRSDAIETLRRNADLIKREPGIVIQIEGHCDERGTQEYNLALGEKRALATRAHLMNLGVSGDRLITISYGEEDPESDGHNESAWAQNRRSQFNRGM